MIEVRLLGTVELVVDGEPKQIGSANQRALLAALAMGPETVVSTDRLTGVLWGESPPSSATTTLQVYVSRLRKVIGPDRIITRAPGYVLTGVVTDMHRFEEFADGDGIAAISQALSLWRGEPFGELGDREPFHGEALRLRHLRSLLEERRVAAMAETDPARAAVEARSLVDAEPLTESRWILLARALAGSGRVAEAVRALDEARRALVEVGLAPSADLEGLEDRLLAGGAGPPAAVRPARGISLPALLEDPIGRAPDLERLDGLLGVHRLVTVVGPGGVGKTSIAQAVGALAESRFADGVFWCDLSAVDCEDAVVPALARALGSSVSGSIEETLMEYVRDRRALVVADNAEHVIGEVARTVGRLLAGAPGISILATSREPLRVASERVFRLEPLDPSSAAVDLFVARAAAAGAPVTDDDLPAVRRIAGILDGLPLALEMAAARLAVMDPATLADRLADSLSVLAPGPRSGGSRHETLTSVVGWSVDLLAPAEQVALERTRRFAGTFSMDAAEAVAGGPPLGQEGLAGILSGLADRSLLTPVREPHGPWFRMLAPVRWALGPGRPEEEESTDLRHAEYYAGLAEQFGAGLVGPDESLCANRLETHIPDLRVAVMRSLDAGWTDPAVRICIALYPMVYHRLRADIGSWCEMVFERVGGDGPPGLATVGALAALAALQRGDIARAVKLCEQARRVAATSPDATTYRIAEVEVDISSYTGDFEDLEERGQEMLAGARAAGDLEAELMALVSTTLLRAYSGDLRAASGAVAEMRRLEPAVASPSVSAWIDYVEGELHLDLNPGRAEVLLLQACETARNCGATFVEGVARLSLASVIARNGRPAAAMEVFGQTVRHWLDLGDWIHQWVTLRNLALLLGRMGRHASSLILLAGVETRERPSYGDEAARLERLRAELSEALGETDYIRLTRQGEGLADRQLVDLALAEAGG